MPANDNTPASDQNGCAGWFAVIVLCLGLLAVGYLAAAADQIDFGPQIKRVEVAP